MDIKKLAELCNNCYLILYKGLNQRKDVKENKDRI